MSVHVADVLKAHREYQEFGYEPIPVRLDRVVDDRGEEKKRPKFPGGSWESAQQIARDQDRLEAAISDGYSDVALVCERIAGLDFDLRDGESREQVRERAREAEKTYGIQNGVAEQTTRGFHVVTRAPAPRNGRPWKKRTFPSDHLINEIQIGAGALLFVAPSINPVSGEAYERLTPLHAVEDLPECPMELLEDPEPSRRRQRGPFRRGRGSRGDWGTLDIVGLFRAGGFYVNDLGGGKHGVHCPWEVEHSTGSDGTDTCIFEAIGSNPPGFRCLHAHCEGRTIRNVREWFGPEEVDRWCSGEWTRQRDHRYTGRARPHGHGKPDSNQDEWPDQPVPPGTPEPDRIPLGAFPKVARDAIESIRDSLQVPGDLPALFALCTAAAAIGDRVEVLVRSRHQEPLCLYGAGIMDPGERKSPVYSRMASPMYRWERDKNRAEDPRRHAALDRVDVLEAHLKALKKRAGSDPEAALELEDTRIKFDKAKGEVPPAASLFLDDVTPEKLAIAMAEQGGRGVIFSSEGDVLRIFAGRYGHGDPRADLLKKAINGEPTKVSRVGRDTVRLPRPILTVGLMFQPTVLGSLENRESLEGEGVFARFLVVQPVSALGSRLTGREIPPPNHEAEERFGNALTRLLDVSSGEIRDGQELVPHVVGLSRDAEDLLFDWEREIELMLSPNGKLRPISGWGGKIFGFTCRIAALLELIDRADRGEPLPGGPVRSENARGAVRIARALATHALKVFGDLGMDQRTSDLCYLWAKIRELDASPPKPDGLTLATLRRAVQGRKSIEGAEDVALLVASLVEGGCVRLRAQEPTGGRPRADRIEVSPRYRKESAESAERTEKTTEEVFSALSALQTDSLTDSLEDESDPEHIEGDRTPDPMMTEVFGV